MISALSDQFKKNKLRLVNKMTEATPAFHLKQFLKAFFYHFLHAFLGPLFLPILFCFETKAYIQNLGFLPSNSFAVVFFIIQTLYESLLLVILYMYVHSKYEASKYDDQEGLPTFPMIYLMIDLTSRFFVISVRAGTTAPKILLEQSRHIFTPN